ncbi:cation:proton antiporter [Prauserella flavalba]|uniref:Cation/H+ exchanger transmembrane domain-containing protein n=1 Tax=Prauserella flavalba TaxID=1477506 RepID=A0A318LED3_9PSEU|nr:cation:proton antiporter [Prauserella flavalba]PXY20018.1 hypothetical protein BA062_34075 [Prauserella flavalba]
MWEFLTTSQVSSLLLSLAVVLVVAQVLGALARRLGQPGVVGELVGGVLLGPSMFGGAHSAFLFPDDIRPLLGSLANVGIALFMFLTGLELEGRLVRGRGRVVASVSIGSLLVPFALGALLALGLYDDGDRLAFTLFLGVAMAATAFPFLARVLADRGLTDTSFGGLSIASAAVCDALAWSVLCVVAIAGGACGGNSSPSFPTRSCCSPSSARSSGD